MGPWAITALMILGFGGFAALAWRKVAIFRALQPEVRWDRPGERLGRVATMGFAQSRMVAGEWKPGIMHAAIFLGFCALLVRKLHLIVIGYDAHAIIPGAGGRGLRDVQGLRRGRGPRRGGLRVLAALRGEAPAPGAQPRGDPHPLADRRDRRLGLPLRRPALRELPGRSRASPTSAPTPPWARWSPTPSRGFSAQSLAVPMQAALLGADDHRVLLPGAAAAGGALPHRHRAAGALPRARHAAQPRALRRPRGHHGRRRGRRHEGGREDGGGPPLEGGLRPLHLHRVRPLQGFLPHLPHRQAARHEVGERLPQAPPAGEARGDRRAQGRGAAAPRGRGDQGGDALGLHHLRLLRALLPHRARAPRALLPPAPAPGDDGRRLPAGAEGRLRRLREPVEPVGAAGRHARRLGEGAGRAAAGERRAGEGHRLALLRGLGAVLRRARAEDGEGLREDPDGRGRALRDPRARARAPPGSACAAPATRCSSSRWRRRSWRRSMAWA